jgi:hypothetical protein
MKEKANQITGLGEVDELYKALSDLLQEAKNMLSSGKLDPNRAGELAEYVVVIRSLLKQLYTHHQRIENKDPVSPINRLREDYLGLEGMVKEIRNDAAEPRATPESDREKAP